MMVIGLTGSIGSGKSTVAAMLTQAHIPVIDADELAREVLILPGDLLEQIKTRFGSGVFDKENNLKRSDLAKIVFNSTKDLRDLEAILHPAIEKLFYEKLAKLKEQKYPVVVYMVPLLFEKNLEYRVDKTLLVFASENTMIDRITKRDNLSTQEAQQRLRAQLSNEEKIARADEIIENNGSLEELFSQLKFALQRLCNMNLSNAE
jgi:dephospho-CoA kinase